MSTWRELLDYEWQVYLRDGAHGNFSHEGHTGAEKFGKVISHLKGKFLDIGCGVLPLPIYMAYPDGEWYGIDPLAADVKREFNFVLGKSENLPYSDGFFDVVVFATSLDHVECVPTTIKEAKRVLKKGGKLVVWTSLRTEAQEKQWKARGGQADKNHLVMFTKKSIVETINLPVEQWDETLRGNHYIIFKA